MQAKIPSAWRRVWYWMGLILDFGYLLGVLAALPWFLYRLTVRGDWRSIPRRLGFGQPPPARGSLWLHGSSAGEIALIRPLVRRLAADHPAAPIVISAYSSTGFAAARKLYPDARVIYFPLDLSFVVRRFLRRYDPRLVVIVESDFWPNFLQAAHARGVPVTVINGKMSERSWRIHARTRLVPRLLEADYADRRPRRGARRALPPAGRSRAAHRRDREHEIRPAGVRRAARRRLAADLELCAG